MNISAQENIYIAEWFLENQIQPIETIVHVNEEREREKMIISCAPGKLISVMNASTHVIRENMYRTDQIFFSKVRQTLTRQLESLLIMEGACSNRYVRVWKTSIIVLPVFWLAFVQVRMKDSSLSLSFS